MINETQLFPDLLIFFAASAAPPWVSVPQVSADIDHPLGPRLRDQCDLVQGTEVDSVFRDSTFTFIHSDLSGEDLEAMAREWHIISLLNREIPRLRRRLLSEQEPTDRPLPYDHPALADLEITDDHLVSLREFELHTGGALVRSDFAFALVPVNESVNASYWLTHTLASAFRDDVFVRLDPLLVCRKDKYHGLEYKMLVYGRALDWDRIAQLKEEEHGRWQPGRLTHGVANTEYVWSPRNEEIHFQCEELLGPARALGWGCRYLHAILDRKSGRVCHLDGALQFMTDDELKTRQNCHLRHAGKVGRRVKVFRYDIGLPPERFEEVTPQFFVWNYDVARYFGNDVPLDL